MRRLLLIGAQVAALSALAAACATRPVEGPVAVAEPAGPAATAGHDWRLIVDPEGAARLAYGGEDTDDLQLAMDCTPGNPDLTLSAPAPSGAKPEIHLESGGDTERYAAQSEPAGVTDGDWLTAEAALSDPVFARFRRLGWVAMWQGGHRLMMASHEGSGAGVGRFFDLCEGKGA